MRTSLIVAALAVLGLGPAAAADSFTVAPRKAADE